MGLFWNPQDLLMMMGTEIFKIDALWAEKLMKTRVSFLMNPTVVLAWGECGGGGVADTKNAMSSQYY